MSKSLTTLIDVSIAHSVLDERFCLYQVSFSSDIKQLTYGKRLAKIDKHTTPLGLISHGGKYWILLSKGSQAPEKLPDIGFVKFNYSFTDKSFGETGWRTGLLWVR
jgi:hypothetical protein